jgi:phosphatidylinositol glycan class W
MPSSSPAGLGEWALSPERGPDLVSLNKEGLVSCPGYYALFLAGGALSHSLGATAERCLRRLRLAVKRACEAEAAAAAGGDRRDRGPVSSVRPLVSLLWPLAGWLGGWACLDALLWALLAALERGVERRSRRSCNAAYVLWTCAVALASLLLLALAQVTWTVWSTVEEEEEAWEAAAVAARRARIPPTAMPTPRAASASTAVPAPAGPSLLEGTSSSGRSTEALGSPQRHLQACSPWLAAAASRNMLVVFLSANLLTGIINMSMDTLGAPDWQGRMVVAAYMAGVACLAAGLDAAGVDVLRFTRGSSGVRWQGIKPTQLTSKRAELKEK